jgi:hypothetical protein
MVGYFSVSRKATRSLASLSERPSGGIIVPGLIVFGLVIQRFMFSVVFGSVSAIMGFEATPLSVGPMVPEASGMPRTE